MCKLPQVNFAGCRFCDVAWAARPCLPGHGRAARATLPYVAMLLLFCSLLLVPGCKKDDMADQAKYKAFDQSTLFADGTSARPIPTGTIARGHLRTDEAFYFGTKDGKPVTAIPMRITAADIQRGQGQFNIFCAVCHGRMGEGDGMVVQRGFPHPPSYHIKRLREAPIGHFFQVMTNGFGAMYSYKSRVSPADRWRIAAYIRALQLSQNVQSAGAMPASAGKNPTTSPARESQ